MFEFDAGKFVIIGIVALIVIGPKELPRVMRQVGQAVAKLRRLSAEFQAQFMEVIREADLEDLKAEAAKISEAAKLDDGMEALASINAELAKTTDEHAQEAPGQSAPETGPAALATHSDSLAEPLAEPHAEALAEPLAESLGEPLHEDPQAARDAVERRDAVPDLQPAARGASAADAQAPGADATPFRKLG